jgi:transcriptional regulator with XRE-family HTH domain
VKKEVGERIRRIRTNLNKTRDDVADQLNMSNSAYSKIERGETDVQVSRLEAIAKLFKVDVVDFFIDKRNLRMEEDPSKQYGIATKEDIELLTQTIRSLKLEVEKLKGQSTDTKKTQPKRKK